MKFLSAPALWLLAVPVALVVVYVAMQLRRPKYAVRFTNLDLLDVVAPHRPNWRRHVSAALLTLGLASMVVALARPARAEEIPVERATVIVAVDVSLSMGATDVEPTRLDAARAAAVTFVEGAPDQVRIGLVVFAGTAAVRVAPTLDRAPLLRAIERLEVAEGTAIGEAIFASLDALAADRPEADCDPADDACTGGSSTPAGARDPDALPPERIVVMSDGETTQGRPNEEGVAAAEEAGVPVSTVAFGTETGIIEYDGQTSPVPVSPGPLRDIAEATGGEFYETATEEGLAEAFTQIGSQTDSETKDVEIGQFFVWMGGALTMLAAAASLFWFSRLP